MFSKSTIALYKSIHAPETLLDRIEEKMQTPVTETAKMTNRSWRTIAAAAACLVVVIAASALAFPGNVLKVNGATVGHSPVAVTSYTELNRAKNLTVAVAPPVVIEMEVNSENVDISVSHGAWTKNSVKGKTVITWDIGVPADTVNETLTLTIDGKTTQYTLYGDDQGVFYMEKKK